MDILTLGSYYTKAFLVYILLPLAQRTCHPGRWGYKTEVKQLSDFHDDYGLEAPGGEENGENDEEEDDDDDDDEGSEGSDISEEE